MEMGERHVQALVVGLQLWSTRVADSMGLLPTSDGDRRQAKDLIGFG